MVLCEIQLSPWWIWSRATACGGRTREVRVNCRPEGAAAPEPRQEDGKPTWGALSVAARPTMLRTAAKRTAVQAAKKKRTSRPAERTTDPKHGTSYCHICLKEVGGGEAGRWQHVRSPAHLSYHMFIGQLPFWMPSKCPCLPIKNHHFCQWSSRRITSFALQPFAQLRGARWCGRLHRLSLRAANALAQGWVKKYGYCSYGHLWVIFGYFYGIIMDYTFYKWGVVSTKSWYFGP